MKKLFVLCFIVAASIFMAASICTAWSGHAVPNPIVIGPIPATAAPGDPSHNYPFYASPLDLKAYGYVEQEYFIEGTANRYTISGTATGTILTSGLPYKTRIIVRRPVNPEKFSGVVFVEWLNVTNGADFENSWFQIYDYVLREGHAWVGVSAQLVGVNALKTWNSARYGSLNVTYPSTSGPATDDLSYDIFSQAGQAIRHPVGIDPLRGLFMEKSWDDFGRWDGFERRNKKVIIAIGHSQSASRLSTYVNAIEPLAQVYSAFALHSSLGNTIRPDLNVPVWKILSEFDVQSANEARVYRPDGLNFTTWEVTGAAHNDAYSYPQRVYVEDRDNGSDVETACLSYTAQPLASNVPFHYAFDAGLSHLIKWVRTGIQMPSAPPIQVQSLSPSIVLARDSYGNAIGGLRLPQVAVPIAANNGTNSSPGSCGRWGTSVPFSESVLKSLYPTHRQYILDVQNATIQSALDGYILPWDAAKTVEDASSASIP